MSRIEADLLLQGLDRIEEAMTETDQGPPTPEGIHLATLLVAMADMCREIHEAVVKKVPPDDRLRPAAQAVVDRLYENRGSWDELKEAIGNLGNVLDETK